MRRRSAPDGTSARLVAGQRGDDGFTLLESLIALTVAAILSIGLVRFMASTHVIAGHADRKFAVAALETAVMAALPAANDLVPFQQSGSRGELDWEMTGVPMTEETTGEEASLPDAGSNGPAPSPASGQAAAAETEAPPPPAWRRYAITVTVRAGGALLDRVETIRIGSPGKAEGDPAP